MASGLAALTSGEITENEVDAFIFGDDAALADLLSGRLSALEGLASGRLVTDHVGALCRLADVARASRVPPAPAPPLGLLRPRGSLPAGKRYPGGSVVLLPDAIAAYAAATGDASVAYRGADGVAPPLIHARLLRDELFALMEDADLKPDLSQLLHVGHDARLARPLRPYEVLQRRASVQHIAQKPGGLLITGSLALVSAGDVVVQAHTVFYVPGQRVAPVGTVAGALPPPLPSPPDRAADHRLDWQMDADQSQRYADASLDHNPIHVNEALARAAGHPGVVVHGLCTLARAVQGVVAALAFDDPRGLRRIGGRFVRPVYNGDRLQTRIWKQRGGFAFSVADAEERPVLADGLLELDP